MAYNGPPPTPRQQAEARFAKSEKHDAEYLRLRKEREAANIARTLELRALRHAKEAREREEAAKNPPPPTKRGRPSPKR